MDKIFKLKTVTSIRRSSSRCGITPTGHVIRFMVITTGLTINRRVCCERKKEGG
jgi:hypothetical protein